MKALALISALSLSFTLSMAQIPNANFEQWDTNQCLEPDSIPLNWRTSCTQLLAYITGFSPTTDAYSGSYASKLSPAQLGDLVLWYVPTIINTSFTVNYIPTSISGYYKLDSQDGDSAMVVVFFKKYNSTTSEYDTVLTEEKILYTTNQYTQFTVDIPFIGLNNPPDSVLIYVSSSYIDMSNPFGGDGTTDAILTVDDLSISGAVGIPDKRNKKLIVFPNPGFDKLYLNGITNGETYSYQIFDASGRLVFGLNTQNQEIDISLLPPGNYNLVISPENGAESFSVSFIKQ